MLAGGLHRFEAAATRAIEIGTLSYGSLRSILDNKLDPGPWGNWWRRRQVIGGAHDLAASA